MITVQYDKSSHYVRVFLPDNLSRQAKRSFREIFQLRTKRENADILTMGWNAFQFYCETKRAKGLTQQLEDLQTLAEISVESRMTTAFIAVEGDPINTPLYDIHKEAFAFEYDRFSFSVRLRYAISMTEKAREQLLKGFLALTSRKLASAPMFETPEFVEFRSYDYALTHSGHQMQMRDARSIVRVIARERVDFVVRLLT